MKILNITFTVIHLLVLLLLAATMLNAYIPPRVFPEFNLLSLAFPILMIINIILCVFWVFSWKKRALVFLLFSTLFLTPVRRWVNYSEENNNPSDFKVLSFNNKFNKFGQENVEDYVNSFDADFVFLQESGNYGLGGDSNFKEMKYSQHNKRVSFFSKYRIVKQDSISIINKGKSVYADVIIKGKRIRFINVYLEPFQLHKSMVKPSSNLDVNEEKAKSLIRRFIPVFKTHQVQIEILKNFIKKSPYPVILAGDFNSVPNSYEYYAIADVLEDSFLEAGKGFSTSFHDYKFPIRIDYIFASKEIKPLSYKVDRTRMLSDHYPVIATFSLKN